MPTYDYSGSHPKGSSPSSAISFYAIGRHVESHDGWHCSLTLYALVFRVFYTYLHLQKQLPIFPLGFPYEVRWLNVERQRMGYAICPILCIPEADFEMA